MNQTILLSPENNIIEQTASCLEADGKDYSANIVVFPGKRPAHFLRKILAEREKGNFIPPRIFSMDDFITFIYQEKLMLSKKPLETIDAMAFLFEIQRKADTRLGADNFNTPDTFLPVGLKIYRDIEECRIEKISADTIKTIDTLAGEKVPEQTLKNLNTLSYFHEKFYKKIEKQGYSTRSLRYCAVSAYINEVDLSGYKKIIMAGFFALTSAEKELFVKLKERENTFFLFQYGPEISNRIKELGLDTDIRTGINAKDGSLEAECGPGSEPDIHFYKSPDTHGQVFALSRIIKERLDNKQTFDQRSVIVLPASESLFPLIAQGLPLLEAGHIPYNISMGYPVSRTPVYGFLNSLMELIASMDSDRVYVPDYLKFVLHPYTKNIYFKQRTDITRIIFHTIEEELSKKRSGGFLNLSELENDSSLLGQIMKRLQETQTVIGPEDVREHIKNIHKHTIHKYQSFKNTGDFALKTIEVLTYIHKNSTARLHPFFTPFLESFLEAMHLMATSALCEEPFKRRSGYFNLLRRYIATRRIPFEGTPLKGLQVLGFLETRNLAFEEVFIFDVNEEVIPDTEREDTLLPFKARKELGLPTYQETEELVDYYLSLLVNSAARVHLFFVEKDKKIRSRFIERLLWQRQKRDKQISDKKYINSIQYTVRLENKVPSAITKTDEMAAYLKEHTYSATSLDTYLKCPLQFYYRYVLGLEERKEVSRDIERMDIGSLVHRILKKYFEPKKGRELSSDDLDIKEMDAVVDKCVKADYGEDISGPAYLLKNQIKKRMREFISDYQIPLIEKQPVSILELEHKINLKKKNFNFTGTIDRVEKRGSNIYIIDYKTSGNSNYIRLNWKKLDIDDPQTWSVAVKTLQLGCYLMLYSEVSGRKIEDMTGLFLLLGKTAMGPDIELPLFSQPQAEYIKTHYKIMETIIFKLLGEITDVTRAFEPATDTKSHCPLCVFSYICGTQWIKR